jgi:hypothetical protein
MFLFVRRYTTHVLQRRINHLFNVIRHVSPQNSFKDEPWRSLSNLPTLDSILARLESLAPPAHPKQSPPLDAARPPPTWLLVRLCSKVRSPADAEKVSHLIVTHLPHVPPALRPRMLVLVVHLLSTYRVFPALDRVIKLFIGLPLFHEHWHFNQLLRALTLYTHSPTDGRFVARLAISLLKTMTERNLSLAQRTYRLLLENPYFTAELTEELHQRMIRDKVVPNRAQLESLLRISVYRGSMNNAVAYARAIHDRDTRREKPHHRDAGARRKTPPHLSISNRSGLAETEPLVPFPTVEYLTHLVHDNFHRKQFNAAAEWSRFLKKVHSHRFLNKQNTSAAAWTARLVSLTRSQSFPPESLVAFFDWSHGQHFPFPTHTTTSYIIVLRSLLRSCAYGLALEVWERYRRHGTIDHSALGVGVEVLTRAGHPDRALALLDTGRVLVGKTIPISLVTCFMRVLSATNPSAALRLWEHMNILCGTAPDTLAFIIMLNAARRATLGGESFAGAMQELGFNFRLPFAKTKPALDTQLKPSDSKSLHSARHRSYAKFEKSLAVNEGDMWGGERAWRRAHRIFTSTLLAGWPALIDVRPPARAIRTSGEGPATAPLRDLKGLLLPPNAIEESSDGPPTHTPLTLHDALSPHVSASEDANARRPPLLPIHPRGSYPSFAPDDTTFRAAVLLLGTARAAGQIPQTLAWMRALGIIPHRRTLAYALVFWAEVSIGAPLFEWLRDTRAVSGGGLGEYARLVRWMEEWVGAQNVPDEASVGEAMRRIDDMRQGRDGGED